MILVREVGRGESVGYDRAFVADRDSRIAVLSVGYGDGVPRNLSRGAGEVLIEGRRAPIVGNICMDQLSVDVTGLPEIRVGMVATLIGRDGEEEITAAQVAGDGGSIANEILSRMGSRLNVVEI